MEAAGDGAPPRQSATRRRRAGMEEAGELATVEWCERGSFDRGMIRGPRAEPRGAGKVGDRVGARIIERGGASQDRRSRGSPRLRTSAGAVTSLGSPARGGAGA